MKHTRLGKVALALFVLCAAVLWGLWDNLTLRPWEREIPLEAPSAISAGSNGGYFVIDSGSRRVLRLDAAGRCIEIFEATDDEERSFQYAQAVTAAGDDGFYIRDVVWRENGMDVAEERIFYRDGQGGNIRIAYTLLDTGQAAVRHKPRLWGPFQYGGRAYFAETGEDVVTLRSLPDGGIVRGLRYQDAETDLSDCALDNMGRLCLVDKRGMIVREEQDGGFSALYRGGGEFGPDCSVPWDMAASENGLVFADIGRRSILRLSESGVETAVTAGDLIGGIPAICDSPILYQVDLAEDGRICVAYWDSVYVRSAEGEVLLHTATLPLEEGLSMLRLCAFAVLVLAVVAGLTAAACLTVYILRVFRPGLGVRMGALVMLSMLVATVIVATIVFRATEERYVEEIFSRMQAAAQSAAGQLDMEALEEIRTPEDYKSENYMRLRASLESAVDRRHEWNRDLYCNIYLYRDGVLFSPIYLDRTTGAFYPLEDEGQRQVMETGVNKRFPLSQTSSGTWMYSFSPLYGRDGSAVGVVDVGIDMHSYQKQTRQLYVTVALSILSACAVVQLLAVQAVGVVEFYRSRHAAATVRRGRERKESIGFIRPVVFLMFFAFNLPTAFLPNYCSGFEMAAFGLAPAFLTAMPMSLNLLATACGSLGSGALIDRFGFRRVGVFGGGLTAASYLGIAFSGGFFPFTACMFLAGLGLGTALNALNACIAAREDLERTKGFLTYNSAYFSGVNCGAVVGALLASIVGEKTVFAAVGICMLLPTVLIFRWMSGGQLQREERACSSKTGPVRFLSHPRILLFLVLGYAPYMLAGHFLYYFLPIFGEGLGLDGTAISQLFLVNGICVLLLTRMTSELFLNRMSRGASARSALLLLSAAFLIFSFMRTVAGVLLTVIVLSIANSFGRSAMSLCFSEQELSRRYGEGRAMGVFSLAENLGETAGPMIFGILLSGDTAWGFRMLALTYGLCAALFLFPGRRGYRGKHLVR